MTDCILNVCLHIKLITGGPCFFSPHPRPMAFYGLRLRRHLPLNSSRKFGSIMLKYDVKTNIWQREICGDKNVITRLCLHSPVVRHSFVLFICPSLWLLSGSQTMISYSRPGVTKHFETGSYFKGT